MFFKYTPSTIDKRKDSKKLCYAHNLLSLPYLNCNHYDVRDLLQETTKYCVIRNKLTVVHLFRYSNIYFLVKQQTPNILRTFTLRRSMNFA